MGSLYVHYSSSVVVIHVQYGSHIWSGDMTIGELQFPNTYGNCS